MTDSKDQLINGLKNRDFKVYEELFFKLHHRLVLFALKFTGNMEAAQDIVQEAFIGLWEKSEKITISDSPKAYLFQSVKNSALNYNRHLTIRDKVHNEIGFQIKSVENSHYSSQNNPYQSLLEFELEEMIHNAIESLPERSRTVFKMSRWQNLKNREIAEELGVSVKMVEKYISKALRILRTKLADYITIIFCMIVERLF